MKLKVNGFNFSDWEDNMVMLFDDFLDNTKYLTTATGRTTYGEKLCCSILTHSVSDTILLSWTNLLDLQMEEEESATALVDWLWSKVRDFKNRNGSFREDHLLGILLQHTTRSQPSISNLVMSKLMAIVSTYSQPPNLGQKLHVTGDNDSVEMGYDEFLGSSIDLEALRTMVCGTCHLCKQQGHFARNPKERKGTRTGPEHNVPGILPNPCPFINATMSH
ncbi:hypothetical protein O181_025564 [Austropuccinia psidii MF-1]|uniref:Uncharacterized protein n=1 Tax=Austropuccinia psidii MF-1 TaxID=1389203 RepID=A0A9Q3CIA6_9BASI|nr:hypothetical protein [Austropuccinia psidii MF-1]